MPKTLKDTPLTTRNARAKLDPSPVPYWRGIDPETHLGYRKSSKHGGTWLVRWRVHPGYRQEPLGTADDKIGEGALDFHAAERKAKEVVARARADAQAAADGPTLTVRGAVAPYIAERDAREARRRGRAYRSDAHRLERYVIGRDKRGGRKAIHAAKLADVPLHQLTKNDLRRWRAGLAETLNATSRERTVNDLKAALLAAYAAHDKRLDPSFPGIVKDGLKANGDSHDNDDTGVRENQILSDAQVTRLLRATQEIDREQNWDGDLYRLVAVLAATGARFSQVVRLRVGDVQRKAGRIMMPTSRKGKGKKAASTPIPIAKDMLDALLPAVTGRSADAPLLERWRHEQKPGTVGDWQRAGRAPWQSASELARPWDDIRKRAKLPGVIAYSLRHSSIVRGIRNNLPIRLVASAHDTSVQMIERHYSRFIVDGLEHLLANAVVPLLPQDNGGEVVSIRERA
jgi:integrase